MPPAGGELPSVQLPVVDEVLAAALTAQGAGGVRALGLLRDARRVLAGTYLERPAEVAESCLRGAADALLSLPGAPDAVGLKSAAKDLLAAVDTLPDPPAAAVPPVGEPAAGGPPEGSPAAERAADTSAGMGRLRVAAEVLRGQLTRPGGFHRARAAGIAERLMGVALGSYHEQALAGWGEVYARTSGTLHGGEADLAAAAGVYREVLLLARELLVPLHGRAARVLELAALTQPGADEAAELARWADPRAEAYFFGSAPAAAWLGALEEHAPHLLLADESAGVWPAAPFLEHLAAAAPETAGRWLAGHAAELAPAGPHVLGALLRLADAGALPPAGVRRLLPHVLAPARPGQPAEDADVPRRLMACWAGTLPLPVRDRDWVLVAEELLKDAVDLTHAGHRAYRDERRRAHAERRPLPELTEVLTREWATRLPEHDITGLLRELVVTVHADAGGESFRWARPVRGALAGLLRRDLETPGRLPWSEFVDLDEVRVLDATLFLGPVLDMGPLLARAVLDLAAADAAAGLPLADRLRAWTRIAAADAAVHDRVLAAHLAAHPPPPDAGDEGAGQWWDLAVEATVRLLAGSPTPEGARLVDLVLTTCPPERAADLHRRARQALSAPAAAEGEQVLPAGAERAGAWSPVLPAPLLADFGPLPAALPRARPGGPPDPRCAARPRSRHHTALELEDLRDLAAAAGPLAAAAALAGAPDAGAAGYAIVLQRLVAADPAAWTADVPAVLTALNDGAELGAFYLAAAAAAARRPGAFPAGPAQAVLAALTLSRTLPAPADPHIPDAGEYAGRAWSGLLTFVWRTGGDLGGHLPTVLDRLLTLAEPLTRPAAPVVAGDPETPADRPAGRTAGEEQELPAGLLESHPAVRALDCLLDYAASHASRDGQMPGDVLDLVAAVLTARGGDQAVAGVLGAHLPLLHRRATAFTAAHPEVYALAPGRPSPAAAWLHEGRHDPLLLTALDCGQLLAVLREEPSGGAAFRVVHALLTGQADLLGDPTAAWRELAAGPGGAEAASGFLGYLALFTSMSPADRTAADTEQVWWTAALEAGLPPGALAGAGDFAAALPDEVWLPLARRSAAHTPAQKDADRIAERAAAHPREPDALLLATHLLARPGAPEYDADVRQHARALLQAAAALPEAERPAEAEQLRRALVEAGEVDLAQTPATG
ncbi:hypothetical protein GCM10017667_54320 [Streptomyces filamentosus]|uniref:Uncharacterized protein n=2 Tax=Streptomyces filamentosus TaxID=67294 RepID=A0A919BU50_STRFL|nr:hypothetical protein GCM10017667_54320 [Streptomyces filamentosus]